MDAKKAFTRSQRESIAGGVLMKQKFGKDLTKIKSKPGLENVVTGSNASGHTPGMSMSSR